jgi:hypothetical protein
LATGAKRLVPILDRFVATFDMPDCPDLKAFYLSVARSTYRPTYKGWITAFSYFTEKGMHDRWRGDEVDEPYLLDLLAYPTVEKARVSSGMVEVPIAMKLCGSGKDIEAVIFAGSVGMEVLDNGKTLQPRRGWIMLETSGEFV